MLPAFDTRDLLPRTDAAAFLEHLLAEHMPELEVVAIARRPGVLSKVAVLRAPGSTWRADALPRVRDLLDGEQIQIITWRPAPQAFVADALGLAEPPPMLLRPALRHAHVLVGEIDRRGMDGWRGINRLLASALTGWRIHLESISASPAWAVLSAAHATRRAVPATAIGATPRGALVDVHGLYATLPRRDQVRVDQELEVRVTRLDPDEGRIFVSRHLAPSGQLALPGT
jgi:transcription antitermination factor NusA-like protein